DHARGRNVPSRRRVANARDVLGSPSALRTVVTDVHPYRALSLGAGEVGPLQVEVCAEDRLHGRIEREILASPAAHGPRQARKRRGGGGGHEGGAAPGGRGGGLAAPGPRPRPPAFPGAGPRAPTLPRVFPPPRPSAPPPGPGPAVRAEPHNPPIFFPPLSRTR